MILRDVRLVDGITAHPAEPVDVRLENGVITEIAPRVTARDAVADGAGRWLVPGLWDHHVHLDQWALYASRVDLSRAGSAAEAAATMLAAAAASTLGGITVGVGFRDALWPDSPSAELVESVHAIAMISADVHCLWLNSTALRALGRPARDWFLREQEAFDVAMAINAAPVDVLDRFAAQVSARAAGRGVVGIVDYEMDGCLPGWERRMAAGFDVLRVEASVYPHELDFVPAPTGSALTSLLTVGRHKLFADGSLGTRTAWCHDPYPEGGHGVAVHPGDELLEWARRGLDRGLLPTIHAIGDRGVEQALDVFAALGVPGRMEHAQQVQPGDLPRFAALGVEASVQPAHLLDDRDIAEHHWAGATDRTYPFADLRAAGVRLLFGSDAPVAPLDPWLAMDAAVNRSWHPEQAMSPAHALQAATGGVRLAVGTRADLALCDLDPLDPAHLPDMTVSATLLGGRPTSGEPWN